MFRHPENYAPGEPSLPGFVDWLRSKDPNEHYEWPNSMICACGQYSEHLTGQPVWGGTNLWNKLNYIARGVKAPYADSDPEDWTFGKCLARALERT